MSIVSYVALAERHACQVKADRCKDAKWGTLQRIGTVASSTVSASRAISQNIRKPSDNATKSCHDQKLDRELFEGPTSIDPRFCSRVSRRFALSGTASSNQATEMATLSHTCEHSVVNRFRSKAPALHSPAMESEDDPDGAYVSIYYGSRPWDSSCVTCRLLVSVHNLKAMDRINVMDLLSWRISRPVSNRPYHISLTYETGKGAPLIQYFNVNAGLSVPNEVHRYFFSPRSS